MATATIEATDWLALRARVDTLVTDPAMEVFEPGDTIPAAAELKPILLLSDGTNDVERVGIDARLHVRSGTLLVAVRWPIAVPVSHTQIKQIQGVIAGHFRADVCMPYGASRLRVIKDSDVIQPYRDGAYLHCPVRVRWSSM